MRYLGAKRLSVHRGDADPTTSPERQAAAIESTADHFRGEVVAWAEDLDVSADKVSPFDRPALGPYLTEPLLLSTYDGIIWSRFDRAIRNMQDMSNLAQWAADHRKVIVFSDGPMGDNWELDFRNGPLDPLTSLMLQIFAFAAQMEVYNIKLRVRDTQAFLRQAGRWGGGMYPYHLLPVKEGNGWKLDRNPETWPVMREIVDRALKRESKRSIAYDLNQRGIPSPREYRLVASGKVPTATAAGLVTEVTESGVTITPNGGDPYAVKAFPARCSWAVKEGDAVKAGERLTEPIAWAGRTIRDQLRAQALLGVVELDGKAVLGADGMPVKRCEPIVSRDEWATLQSILNATQGNGPTSHAKDASLLLGIADCPLCGERLYFKRHKVRKDVPVEYEYYGCRSAWGHLQGQPLEERCQAKSIRADDLEAAVEAALLRIIGDVPVLEPVVLAGESHADELAEATAAYSDLLDQSAGKPAAVKAIYDSKITALEERITRLSEMPETETRIELVPTGKTYREVWETADKAGRRKLLLDSGIRVEGQKSQKAAKPFTSLAPSDELEDSGLMPVVAFSSHGVATATVTFPSDLIKRAGGPESLQLRFRKQTVFEAMGRQSPDGI